MAQMPEDIRPTSHLFIANILEGEDLGKNEKDFSNVEWGCVDMKTDQVVKDIDVQVFATGRLGGLTGGLMHLADLRSALTSEDVTGLALAAERSHLDRKRTAHFTAFPP